MTAGLAVEVGQFAASVRGAAERHPVEDVWRPGAHADDRNPALRDAVLRLGWDEVGGDANLLPFVAPAALELGRRFAPLDLVDTLLGGALMVDGYARYVSKGDRVVEVAGSRLRVRALVDVEPVGYIDALAVHRVHAVEDETTIEGVPANARLNAWIAASVGYLAGLSTEALRLATDHAKSRVAFGRTLAALEPVQQHLATAATLVDGVCLLVEEPVTPAGLAHAGEAACRVAALCQQVVGAIGYTLEFPLQRAFRRSRAVQLWADATLAAMAPGGRA
jgi:Acyl-CoA dehydrogenase, C-terminal domain